MATMNRDYRHRGHAVLIKCQAHEGHAEERVLILILKP